MTVEALKAGRHPDSTPPIVDQLYRRHAADLVRYLVKRFGNGPPDPEDVAQATFAKLLALEEVADLANPRAYLYAIACNTAIDIRRRINRSHVVHQDLVRQAASAPAVELSSERVAISRERLQQLEEAMRRMPAMRRRIFLLVRVEGLSPRHVAVQFGISEGAVHKHISRALQDCAAMLEQAADLGGRRR